MEPRVYPADQQLKLTGYLRTDESDNEFVVVRLPDNGLVERTLVVSIPDEDDDGESVPCYLHYRLLDPASYKDRFIPQREVALPSRDPSQEIVLYGRIKGSNKSDRELITIHLYEGVLLVNIPAENQEELYGDQVLCYLKHKYLPEDPAQRSRSLPRQGFDQRSRHY